MTCTRSWMIGALALALGTASASAAAGQTRPPAPPAARAALPAGAAACDDMLPPLRSVKGLKHTREFKVGPTACAMAERTGLTINGRQYVRLDVGLDGSVDGYVSTNPRGDYRGYMTNAPDLVFPQTADPGPIELAIVRYGMSRGAVMSIIYPADRAAWNGKMWVTVHGANRGGPRIFDAFDKADQTVSAYDEQTLARGYVVVKTRRVANVDGLSRAPNPKPTGLEGYSESDKSVTFAAFNDTHHYVTDFTLVADNIVRGRLGKAPTRTYFYGHSAGARMGRGFNYTPGLNKRPDGRVLFDGFLVDDSGAGTWLPIVMKNGEDVLFKTEADKAAMVPQLEIVHQMYNNIWETSVALGVTHSYLENKRTNARMMRDKGLGDKFRAYEVRSISHAGSGPGLDVAPLFGQMFEMLDAWVDKGVAPPPTRSDWKELGDADRDGKIESSGLSLPQISCPLGVYYPVTTEAGNIDFAPFTGKGLEPLDRNKVFVDMNRNGSWDYRETPTDAWRRLGLIGKEEELKREKYVSCVTEAAELLRKDGFLSPETVNQYIEQAKTTELMPRETSATASSRP